MSKAWVVARHEFAVTVKRLWFVLATFVFPLLSLGVLALMILLQVRTMEDTKRSALEKPLGLVDLSGELREDPRSFNIRRLKDEAEARAAFGRREISSCLVVPEDWVATG